MNQSAIPSHNIYLRVEIREVKQEIIILNKL